MSFIQQTEQYYQLVSDQNDFEVSKTIYDHKFLYDDQDFAHLMSHFQEEPIAISKLAQMGGYEGIAFALRTNPTSGLGEDEVNDPDAFELRKEKFGFNEITQKESDPFWKLCLDELGDPMLRVLIVAGVVSIIIGAVKDPEHNGWIDGLAILIAVLIVVLVGGTNNWQKEKQFRAMEEESKKKNTIVLRGGKEKSIPFSEVVVGDLVVIRFGFQIPCDGIFVYGTENLKAEESGLTGEAKEIKKSRFHPLLMKGTNIVEGEGLMIAVAVGDRTEWGQLMAKLQDERSNTPLQDKLDRLGVQIGWGGTGVAISLFLILLIKWAITDLTNPETAVLDFFIIAITIIVVAVPEGLPLAVTISLAYSMKKMILDNNFVRHLQACETMGNATTICSDKTGTLTTNKMTVNKCHIFNEPYFKTLPTKDDFRTSDCFNVFVRSICCNTTSFQDEPKDEKERQMIESGQIKPRLTGANQTDCAMLQWAIDLGADYKKIRETNPVTKFFPFDSKIKRSSVIVKESNNIYLLYVKGAAELILELCDTYLDHNGNNIELNNESRSNILRCMDTMTRNGLRCLGSSYRRFNKSEIPFKQNSSSQIDEEKAMELFTNMVWISVAGIADPVREEVPTAVQTCHKAGIVVRMVTGDHLETARHIAKQCRILTCDEHICMTGSEFRNLSDDDKAKKLPFLRVLARSRPADKEALVAWYKNVNGDIVAVTGDGANDALALKNADVGLAMGIQGTDVAKEASDVIIMDDNFASIEKTVMWGRSVYDNIRKFVQFQLTVNVVALTISLIAAFTDFQNPLTAVQLLWVNLIMDTMAALALATEDPTRQLLERHPFNKESHLITQVLWRFIFGHSVYQITILLLTMFFANDWLDIDESKKNRDGQSEVHLTIIFNAFVWMQIFNEFNARKVNNEINVFDGICRNMIFWYIMVITIILQVIMVEALRDFADTTHLNAKEWGYCIAVGFGSILWHQVVRLVPINLKDGIQEVDSERLFREEKKYLVKYDHNDNNDDIQIEMEQ